CPGRRLRHGVPWHLRQGRPGRARRRRRADAAGPLADRRRDGGVSRATDLTDVAERVVGWARDDEAVEVVVGRSRHTEVRAYQRDVESLSSAESMGVGIRVVQGDRQGFAYAATLDEGVLAETLVEARDNAGFATPDPHAGLAEPDG